MILHREKISDAIELSVIQTEKFKTSIMSFSMAIPVTKEAYAYNILLAHTMRRGTKTYPSTRLINKRLDELYGSYIEVKNHRIGENILLNVTAEVLDNKYISDGIDVASEAISIAAELILSPAFVEPDFNISFFEQEKKLICESIDAEINNTRVYSAKRCTELMQVNTDIPSSSELKRIISEASLDKLLSYYEYLKSNARLSVFCVSADSTESLKEKILAAFKSYPSTEKLAIVAPHTISRDDYVEITESMPVSQGKLSLIFSSDAIATAENDKYYTMLMLNEILGGSASSKLFLNVREKLGICYYCSSSYSIYSGMMLVSSGFEVNNYSVAREAILAQLEDIRLGKISDAEFLAAQKSITSSYRQLFDSPFDLQSFYGDRALFGIADGIDDSISKLLSVTKNDIIELSGSIELKASFFVKGNTEAEKEDDDDSADI